MRLAVMIALPLSFVALVAGAAEMKTAQADLVEMALPRAPVMGEAVWARIFVAPLPRGACLRVSTLDGTLVDCLAPVGVLRGQGALSYDVPLPPRAIAAGHVRLRLDVVEAGGATRAPVAGEVAGVELRYVPVTR
jgi:hypothetical protein